MKERGTFSGFIRDGHGAASRDVYNGVYPSDVLGFDPYPGTLNLSVDRGTPAKFGPPDEILAGPECPLHLWRGHIADIPVVVMWPDREPPVERATLVEVLAPVKLREAFTGRVRFTI